MRRIKGVLVQVAFGIGEGAGFDAHIGVANGVGLRREHHGVLGVAVDAVARGGNWCEGANGAAAVADVGLGEGQARLAEHKGDDFGSANAQHVVGGARDGHHGGYGVHGVGVKRKEDLVVALDCGTCLGGVVGVLVGVARHVRELARFDAHAGRARADHGSEGGHILGVAGCRAARGFNRAKACERAELVVHIIDVKAGARFTQRKQDGFALAHRACARAADHDGGRCGVRRVGGVAHGDHVVGLIDGATHAFLEGVHVVVARQVGDSAVEHTNFHVAAGVGRWRVGGCVLREAAQCGAAGAGHGHDVGDRAAAADDGDAGDIETGQLTDGEEQGFCLARSQGAAAQTGHGDIGRRGVGAGCVVANRDLVVGVFYAGQRVAVLIEVACVVTELASQHAHGACACAAYGREGGSVFGVATRCCAGAGHGRKVAKLAAHGVDVAFTEGGAGFTEFEGDGFGADHAWQRGACQRGAWIGACDHDGRWHRVHWIGVVAEVDCVVGVFCTGEEVAVLVQVACGVSELGRLHADLDVTRHIGWRGVDRGVTGVTRGRCARRGVWHQSAQGAQAACVAAAGQQVDVVAIKAGAWLAQREGDGVCTGHGATGSACDGDRGRCGVGVKAYADLVVAFLHGACNACHVGVQVVVAGDVCECARGNADGGCAHLVGCRRVGACELRVVAACNGHQVGHLAAVGHVKVCCREAARVDGLAEGEDEGVGGGHRAGARARDGDGGRCGVCSRAGVGVDRGSDQVVGFVVAAGGVKGVCVQVA